MSAVKHLALWLSLYTDSLTGRLPDLLPPIEDPVEMQRAFACRLLRPTERQLDNLIRLREFLERRGDPVSLNFARDLRADEARLRREIEFLRMGMFPPLPPPEPKSP